MARSIAPITACWRARHGTVLMFLASNTCLQRCFWQVSFAFRRKLCDGRYFIPSGCLSGSTSWECAGNLLALQTRAAAYNPRGRGRAFVVVVYATTGSSAFKCRASVYVTAALALSLVLGSVVASASAAPYFRLYTNVLGGGMARAGSFFPHDEFYDASMRDVILEIARRAKPGARVATETPGLAAYYGERAGRSDLVYISLSDPEALKQLSDGDFLVDARGRRYFSNDALISALNQTTRPTFQVALGGVPAATVYLVDHAAHAGGAKTTTEGYDSSFSPFVVLFTASLRPQRVSIVRFVPVRPVGM